MGLVKLSEYVFEHLAQDGVKHVFMLPGGGCMHLVDSLGQCGRIGYTVNLHEQACAIAAQAYAQYTGGLGVALVTTGPGGTNALTGVAGAWVESTPCLFISGQAKRADLLKDRGVRSMGQQELDIVSIVRPITKYAVTIDDPNTIRYHLEKALHIAKHGRPGPVWVDIPLDVQAANVDQHSMLGFDVSAEQPTPPNHSLAGQVAQAIELLGRAERPVCLAGYGIRAAGAEDEFLALADLLQIPLLMTWKAADLLPESHPLYVGRPGGIGQRGANFTLQNSDCILLLGTRLDLPQTAFDHQNFARAADKIMVDADPAEISKM
ncbi:MAG: thiamine pyrophosphate-binding protein, partial [Armatimonadota bacterium]